MNTWKLLAVGLFLSLSLHAQTTKIAPDCPVLLGSSTTTKISAVYDNRPPSPSTSPCSEWILFASATTANASFTVTVQSAQDNGAAGCAGCTWTTFASLTLSAEGVVTATKSYADYIRINLSAISGGSVSAALSGWRADQSTTAEGSGGVGCTITGFTPGSVLYIAAGPLCAQDNANFNWNDSTDTLSLVNLGISGVGTAVTQPSADNSTDLATDQFVQNAVAGVTPGIPIVPANQTTSGCGVQYTSGLSFTVGACNYTIAGVSYSSPLTNLTLTTADPSNPRIDALVVDNAAAPAGEAVVVTGTPAASPATPSIDPSTQLALAYVLVNAGASTPANITVNTIYDEDTEWTCTASAHFNCASTNNPYHGSKDIEATAAVLNNNVTLVDPAAGTVDLATQNSLLFYIRSKSKFPTGTSGSTAARFINIFWKNGSTVKGTVVTLRDGAFGFSSSNTTSYQQISIPASAFGIFGIPVTTLELQVSGPSGSSSIGFYVDWISLQSGVAPVPSSTTLMNFKGTWNSSATYNANDTVVSGGIGYVALIQNTDVSVGTSSTWAPLAPAATNIPATTPVVASNGTTLIDGTTTGTGSTVVLSASPAFTGTPTAPTPSSSDNSTKIPTTAYVQGVSITCTAPQFVSAISPAGSTCLTPVLTENSQSAAYQLVLGDAGKMILHPTSDNNARTFTIPANGTVAFPTGTCVTFVNMVNTVTIAITTDTMTLMGANTTGSRTLAVGNWATACKIDSTDWIIGGSSGLT